MALTSQDYVVIHDLVVHLFVLDHLVDRLPYNTPLDISQQTSKHILRNLLSYLSECLDLVGCWQPSALGASCPELDFRY
jgi:hypothetical protein